MPFAPVTWSYRDPITEAKLDQMVENLRTHDHRADGSQGAPYPRVATGVGVENRSAAGTLWTPIAFPAGRFTTAPRVAVSMGHPQVGVVMGSWGVRNVTTTGAEVGIDRDAGTSNLTFSWFAVQS